MVRSNIITIVIGLIVILICPFSFVDLVIGGFVGSIVARCFSQRIGVLIIGGLLGGLVALGLLFMTFMIFSGDVSMLITNWRDVLSLIMLMLWTIPGIGLAILTVRLSSAATQTESHQGS